MFKKLLLKNFKSYETIEFDLTRKNKLPKQLVFIYGENGSGKSNLLYSFTFLKHILHTMCNYNSLKEIIKHLEKDTKLDIDKEKFAHFLNEKHLTSLQEIAKSAYMVDANKNMFLRFDFYLNGKNGFYEISFDNNGNLSHEKLNYLINNRIGNIFEITLLENEEISYTLNNSTIVNDSFKEQLVNSIKEYWGKHTFLAMILSQINEKNNSFIQSSLNKNFLSAIYFFRNFSIRCQQSQHSQTEYSALSNKFLSNLSNGEISSKELTHLKIFETVLNSFFTRLYSDIKKVYYKTNKTSNKISYKLYFEKQIFGKTRKISFDEESTGTQKILDIFPLFYECTIGRVAIIDEIDTGIHDLLMSNLIVDLSDYFEGQFIATTHNTLLLEKLDPESVYIIQIDDSGNKKISCLKNINKKTQKNHNHRQRYLNGLYNGISFSQNIYLDEIVQNALKELDKDEDKIL